MSQEGETRGEERAGEQHLQRPLRLLFPPPINKKHTNSSTEEIKKKQQLTIDFSGKKTKKSHADLLDLLQLLLQRVDGVLLFLQAFKSGYELGCKLCRLHRDHLLRGTAGTLWGEGDTLASVISP